MQPTSTLKVLKASRESLKAQRSVSNILNLSGILIHDLNFATYSVLDDKNDDELHEAKTLLESIRDDAEKTIKQIKKVLSK